MLSDSEQQNDSQPIGRWRWSVLVVLVVVLLSVLPVLSADLTSKNQEVPNEVPNEVHGVNSKMSKSPEITEFFDFQNDVVEPIEDAVQDLGHAVQNLLPHEDPNPEAYWEEIFPEVETEAVLLR